VKFRLTVNGHNLLVDVRQLEILVDTLTGAEHLSETHVGSNKGSQGYQNAFVPIIKPVVANDLFTLYLALQIESEVTASRQGSD